MSCIPTVLLLSQLHLVGGLDIALVCLTFDPREKFDHVPHEEGVLKLDLSDGPLHLVKVIHVQLPDKRVQIVVLEESGEGLLCELIAIDDLETSAVGTPLNDAFLTWFTNDLEKLFKEGRNFIRLSFTACDTGFH